MNLPSPILIWGIPMSVESNVTAFYPDYDASKLAVFVSDAEAIVTAYIGYSVYPSGYTDLDSVTARLVRQGIDAESRGHIKSVSIEGYSETYSEMDIGNLAHSDHLILNKYYWMGEV